MSFTAITAGQVDADSPVDSVLMGLMRTNLDDLDARFPITSVATGAIDQTAIASAAVGQGELITAQGAVSVGSGRGSLLTLPGGEYGFHAQYKN